MPESGIHGSPGPAASPIPRCVGSPAGTARPCGSRAVRCRGGQRRPGRGRGRQDQRQRHRNQGGEGGACASFSYRHPGHAERTRRRRNYEQPLVLPQLEHT